MSAFLMVHGFTVLAIAPTGFLRRFRSDNSTLIYDPSLGTKQGRVISEEDAVHAVAGYDRLYTRMQRFTDRAAKSFILSGFLSLFLMATVAPTVGKLLLELALAALAAAILFANFNLWQFRQTVWKSVERNYAVNRLSTNERIRRTYRMSWPERIRLFGIMILLGPIYLFGHIGGQSGFGESVGLDGNLVRYYHRQFIVGMFLMFLISMPILFWRKRTKERCSIKGDDAK